jgi:hypothetical protein
MQNHNPCCLKETRVAACSIGASRMPYMRAKPGTSEQVAACGMSLKRVQILNRARQVSPFRGAQHLRESRAAK